MEKNNLSQDSNERLKLRLRWTQEQMRAYGSRQDTPDDFLVQLADKERAILAEIERRK